MKKTTKLIETHQSGATLVETVLMIASISLVAVLSISFAGNSGSEKLYTAGNRINPNVVSLQEQTNSAGATGGFGIQFAAGE